MKLKKISSEQFEHIIGLHDLWFGSEETEGQQANLSYTDLSDLKIHLVSLSKANLKGADLNNIDLSEADFSNADLTGVNLEAANLCEAHLQKTNLTGAILKGTDLGCAYLSGATLTNANLTAAILGFCDLTGANLTNTNLSNASLDSANLSGANFSDANFSGVYLRKASLHNTNLSNTDLTSVQDITQNQLYEAYGENVKLPKGLVLLRRCKEDVLMVPTTCSICSSQQPPTHLAWFIMKSITSALRFVCIDCANRYAVLPLIQNYFRYAPVANAREVLNEFDWNSEDREQLMKLFG